MSGDKRREAVLLHEVLKHREILYGEDAWQIHDCSILPEPRIGPEVAPLRLGGEMDEAGQRDSKTDWDSHLDDERRSLEVVSSRNTAFQEMTSTTLPPTGLLYRVPYTNLA